MDTYAGGSLLNLPDDTSSNDDILLNIIVNEILDMLSVNYTERDIFMRIVKSHLEKSLLGRNNAFYNYYNNKLKSLLPSIYLNFDLDPKDIEIDRSHGDDAKLYSIIKTIKKRYDITSPKRAEIPNCFGKRDEDSISSKN